MFWEEGNEPSFYKDIWKPDNFVYLNGKNVIYPHVADIGWKYFEEDEGNFDKSKNFSLSVRAHILKSIALLKKVAWG